MRHSSLSSAEEEGNEAFISHMNKCCFKTPLSTSAHRDAPLYSLHERKLVGVWMLKHHSPLVQVVPWFSPDEMRASQTPSCKIRQSLRLVVWDPQTEQRGGLKQRRRSGAGHPHVHLFGKLQHKDNIGPLVRVRADAHADQVPQL